jgi:hypothetical protein
VSFTATPLSGNDSVVAGFLGQLVWNGSPGGHPVRLEAVRRGAARALIALQAAATWGK